MRTDDGQTIRLEDYRETDFRIDEVDLAFDLNDGIADVRSRIVLERRLAADTTAPLVLVGDGLDLVSVAIDGSPLDPARFTATPELLTVTDLPATGPFTLEVRTRLSPEANTQLMGLYRSNGIWCTQCEAEGFRRITYFLDRPDVLATYRVRIEADRAAAPTLLSNGNLVESGEAGAGPHFAVWHDPFPKPSYLFALVAGDLDVLEDRFTTASGRDVALAIHTEKGMAERAAYAMDALKRSMVWDERRFGREYDLDIFNIVAIADFNMGAMENKGLNVFNHKYVLLDPQTATDADYAGVETVIAHEYFHNWTGNRITCRDWFQLCLKEGLTVYRDQEFSGDERSATVKRIASVHNLKSHQFPEDQGPLQHPVRPTRYREINNFYTATVYDKGAELVRMIATILGQDAFRAGMDLYFQRHDGEATTIEAFIACFEEAARADLSQFALWYGQAGTPTLGIEENWDAAEGRLTLTLRQSLARGAAGTGTLPMHIPVRIGLVGTDGTELPLQSTVTGASIVEDVVHLVTAEASLVFEGLGERPLVSALRDFSAPVTLEMNQSLADRLALARLDTNGFGRWRALSDVVGEALVAAARNGSPFPAEIADAIIAAAADEALEPALRAQMTTLASEGEIARLMGADVDPDAIREARIGALKAVGSRGAEALATVRAGLSQDTAFSPDAASAGKRALANALLVPLSVAADDPAEAQRAIGGATNMTDRLAALALLVQHFPEHAATEGALADFYARFENDDLVLDKWFLVQAGAPGREAVEAVKRLARHERFRLSNPNRARSLIGGFAMGSQTGFHQRDGSGYRFMCTMLAELDALNPQTAARLATAFRSWRSLETTRRDAAEAALRDLGAKPLSVDLKDIVERTLA